MFHDIIQSKTLRATHLSYSNDREEYILAIKMARDVLSTRYKVTTDRRKQQFYNECLTLLKDETPYASHIICFSEEKDLLSQWRAYGGYNIEFNSQDLFDIAKPFFLMRQWIYDPNKQKSILEVMVDFYETDLRDPLEDVVNFLCHHVGEAAVCFKHESFREEKEWRLIGGSGNHRKFKADGSVLKPHSEFELLKENLCISGITLGPNNSRALAEQSLKWFVSDQERENENRKWEVYVSQSPLVT